MNIDITNYMKRLGQFVEGVDPRDGSHLEVNGWEFWFDGNMWVLKAKPEYATTWDVDGFAVFPRKPILKRI